MDKFLLISIFSVISIISINTKAIAQTDSLNCEYDIEYLPYGDMDSWINRVVQESSIIGGKTKILYEITKGKDIEEPNVPYSNMNGSPWATSNVYAHVAIVHKGVNTVSSEKRGDGYCALLETTLEHVKVLGIINLNVIATGTIFIGEMIEPITSTDDANEFLSRGMPFTRKPKELIFDYSLKNVKERMYASGISKPKVIEGTNAAEVILILQKRWEDSDGNIYAKRIGMACERFSDNDDEWKNKYKMKIYYGDCSKYEFYKDDVKLDDYSNKKEHKTYALNSKGVIKPVIEVGWGDSSEQPTHLMLSFSSGWGGAYCGSPGTRFCVDNIGFTYNKVK